jgi:hypothetical protein
MAYMALLIIPISILLMASVLGRGDKAWNDRSNRYSGKSAHRH